MRAALALAVLPLGLALAGCQAHGDMAGQGDKTGQGDKAGQGEKPAPPPTYLGSEVRLMGGDLVQIKAAIKPSATDKGGDAAVQAYARCQMAGFAIAHKAGYLRRIRTLRDKEGGVWRADAVYSVTSDKPAGQNTIDAAEAVRDCEKTAIPTGS
jgi:hypothetical protein